ncbi:MAG: hypothetical protein Q7J64_01725 [Elusimicrobiota bacterium]|nr:hypothetical protein [Elusimicrobiota bacterium]
MNRRLLLAALVLAAGCSRKAALNYRHCLKLRIGMTQEQVFAAMGAPEESFPYIEGKSLPHLLGRTAYEWANPASMPAPNRVSFDDASGKAESIRCGDSVVTAQVFVEPPEPAVSTFSASMYSSPAAASTSAATAPARPGPRQTLRERGSSSSQSSGRPLTE